MKVLLLSGVMALGFVGAAQADVMFILPSTALTTTLGGTASAGTLTGSFTTNDALSAVTTYDITASAASPFDGFHYTTTNSSINAALLPSLLFQIDTPGSITAFSQLRLYFSEPLSASAARVSSEYSYEHEPSGGNRFLTSDTVVAGTSVTAVPEPASFVVLGMGLVGVAAMRRRWVGMAPSTCRGWSLPVGGQDDHPRSAQLRRVSLSG